MSGVVAAIAVAEVTAVAEAISACASADNGWYFDLAQFRSLELF